MNEALRLAAQTKQGLTLVDSREHETFISFTELYASARRVAANLVGRGVVPNDRIALVLPTGRDFLEAFFGAQLAGAVPVPLYPPVRLGRMGEYVQSTARMMTAVRARMVVSDRRVKLLLGKAIELARPELGCPTVNDLLESPAEAECAVTPHSLAVIQFSSGSTVDPKPVALTHDNVISQLAALEQLMGPGNVGVSWLPLYHDMGLIGCLLSAVYQAGHLVLLAPELFLAKPALWLRAISRYRATISPAPNFAYGLCLKRVHDEDLEGLDLSSWRFALNGAEPVSPETIDRFAERFSKYGFRKQALMPVYGLSEASLAVTFTSPTHDKTIMRVDPMALASAGHVLPGSRGLVSVGVPVPGAEVEVRADDGVVLAEKQAGRVFTRGASVMRGYFNNPEATTRAVRDGWLDTGDVGFVHGGELFICGRAKDIVIIRGANHAPQEFEECLDAVHGVRTGCAVAVGFVPPDANDEQLLLLVEKSTEPVRDVAQRVSDAVNERTGIKPHTVVMLEPGTLPRTSSGKLRRIESLRRYLANTLDAPEQVNALSMGREIAKSVLGHAKALFTVSGPGHVADK
jgi:acyl-CoA synthetase (AMP-forming)/AMP-acid ligase II